MIWRRTPNSETWQRTWHTILDAHGVETLRPKPLPPISEDFRLHFDVWSAPVEARRAAFSILPCGDALFERAERVLDHANSPLTPDEAEAALRDALRMLATFGNEAPHPETPITHIGPSAATLHQAFADACTPALDLDDTLPARAHNAGGTQAEAAYYFLSEPLYRLRSDYDVAHWVVWPLCAAPEDPDVYAPLCRLALGGWSAGESPSRGLFLYDRRDSSRA